MLECVVNISEGRNEDILGQLARACGPALLDVHTDPDHHRAVFTLVGSDPGETDAAAHRLATTAAALLSITDHAGVHPRLGVIDVVPFVALPPTPTRTAVDAARRFAHWMGADLGIPAFLYDLADPAHRSLPTVRRDAFSVRAPDAGPSSPHPRAGATAVGARPALVAVNLELDVGDLGLASAVAREVRERDGGLRGVRALGLELPSVARAQVSMNLVDVGHTGLEAACVAVRERVAARGGRVRRVELVGLVPAAVLATCSRAFLEWSGLGRDDTIEARMATRTGGRAGGDAGSTDATPGGGPVPLA